MCVALRVFALCLPLSTPQQIPEYQLGRQLPSRRRQSPEELSGDHLARLGPPSWTPFSGTPRFPLARVYSVLQYGPFVPRFAVQLYPAVGPRTLISVCGDGLLFAVPTDALGRELAEQKGSW